MKQAGMRLRSVLAATACLLCVAMPAMSAEGPGTSTAGAWAERVQILYDAETRSVARRLVRVWDFHPQMNLDFVWEPAAGPSPDTTVAADGTVTGKGKLVWRVRGSASYDPATVYSSYFGEMKDGRPNGQGRLQIRTGEVFEGQWSAGVLDGQGVHVDTAGNRYEGGFVAGLPNGKGRLLSRTGEIFEGTFINGRKDGKGRTRLAGGTVYESQWAMGREVGANRPDVLADARVGGLIKAQAGGGDAGKVEIGVVVDDRMTQQSDMQYQHLVRDEDVAIYPVSEEYNAAWNGDGTVRAGGDYFQGMDWENAPAFAEVGLETTGKGRVKLKGLEMKVASSEAYRKPMLSLEEHNGCVGFRPDFSILNNGWGEAKDLKVSIRFRRMDEQTFELVGDPSPTYTVDAGTFADGVDVSIKDVLQQAGVDTAALEKERFTCPSQDAFAVCRRQVLNKVDFGELADYVYGSMNFMNLTGIGTLDYSWTDDYGNTAQQSEAFQLNLTLAYLETPEEAAECGDGFGGSPEATRYQDVEFPIDKHDYVIPMPVRGNRNIESYTARLKMWSSMSSIHRFSIAAKFADGSVRESKPVTFFYFRPKETRFESKTEPAACYLPRNILGCG
jgi:hypothetical protein